MLCPAFLALFSFFLLLLHPGDALSNLSIYGQEVRSNGRVRGRLGPWGGTGVPHGGWGPRPPLGVTAAMVCGKLEDTQALSLGPPF